MGFRVKYGDLLKGFTGFPVFRTTSEGVCLFISSYHSETYIQLVWWIQRESMARSQLSFVLIASSSLNFAAGFFGVQTYQSDYYQLIEIEASGFNSTLAPYDVCPNSNNQIGGFGNVQANKWAEIYLAPAVARLSPFTTFPLNATVLLAMQTMCAYETNALGYSAFCDLFTEDEWESFEYTFGAFPGIFSNYERLSGLDLQFWYSNGPGKGLS